MFITLLQQATATGMENHPYAQLAGTGIVGTLLIISLGVIRHLFNELKEERKNFAEERKAFAIELDKKDQAHKDEMKARIEDSQKFNGISMAIQKEVMETVDKLSDFFDVIDSRDAPDKRR